MGILPGALRRVKIFTQILRYEQMNKSWCLMMDPSNSTSKDISQQVNEWVEATFSMVEAADTRTDIQHPSSDVRLVILTTTVVYLEATTDNVDPRADRDTEFIPIPPRGKPKSYPGGAVGFGSVAVSVQQPIEIPLDGGAADSTDQT